MAAQSLTDTLSSVFDQVEVRGLVTGGFAVRGPWASQVDLTRPLKVIALVAGSAHLRAGGEDGVESSVELAAGDVVLLNHRTHLEVRGARDSDQGRDQDDGPSEGRAAGPGGGSVSHPDPEAGFDPVALSEADLACDDVLIGGWIRTDPAGLGLFRAALPGVVHVRAATPAGSRLQTLVAQVFAEASGAHLGSAFALRQLGQLVLLEVLRAFLEQEQPPAGWLRLLGDPALAPAVRLIHDHPGRSWGLAELARAAGMSRTSFAERFRSVAGVPPVTYLGRWRMVLAQRALLDADTRVGALASALGYGSESAFSTAFKREVGLSPLHYRRQVTALG